MNEVITSAKNPRVLFLQSLQQKRHREAEGKFLIEGLRFVKEAIVAGAQVEEIFLSPEVQDKEFTFLQGLPGEVAVTVIAQHLFKKFTDTENPQGIAALVTKSEPSAGELLNISEPFILIIEQVQDPGNLGTIIRTADAAGVTGIIHIKGTVDPYNPKTLRSTMGSVFHLPIALVETVDEACRLVNEKGVKTYATDVSTAAKDYLDVDFRGPIALVIGNEARGISDSARDLVDEQITIKMPGRAESLNVSVATGILLFEAARQRRRG